jgi:hypothetical protein
LVQSQNDTNDNEFAFEVDDMKTLELEYKSWKMDCVIIDTDQYVDLLHNYKVILTLWLPDEFVWYEDADMHDVRVNWLAKYNMNLRAVQRNLVLWCYATARRSWFDGDKRRARKNLVHGIRYLLFAHQLFEHGAITDYRAATPFYKQVFESGSDDWEFYDNLYKPLYAQMKKDLQDNTFNMIEMLRSTQSYLTRDHYLKVIRNNGNVPFTVQFVRENGLAQLSRKFGIWISPITNVQCENGKQLVKLTRSKDMRKYEWSIVRECSGMIIEVDMNNDRDVNLVCLPLLKIVQFWQSEADTIDDFDIQSLVLTKKYNGTSCCLYCYGDKWNLSHAKQREGWKKSLGGSVELFENEFWKIWEQKGYALPSTDHQRKCFIFQYVNNESMCDIMFIAVRDLDTLDEEDTLLYSDTCKWHEPERMSLMDIVQPSTTRKKQVKKQAVRSTLNIFVDIMNNKHLRPVYDYANDIAEMDPLHYSGYVCRDTKFNRVNIESAVYFYGPQLEPFFEIVDHTPIETIDSWHNDYCMVEIIRCVLGATTREGAVDHIPELLLHFQDRHGKLYVDKYNKMKYVMQHVCDTIDNLYREILAENQVPENEKIEKFKLNTILEGCYPFKKTIPVFVMREHNLASSRKSLLPRYKIDTRVVYNMYLDYCDKFLSTESANSDEML